LGSANGEEPLSLSIVKGGEGVVWGLPGQALGIRGTGNRTLPSDRQI
jgi:hypothetical protein